MRARLCALGSLFAMVMVAPAWAGDVYVIETSQGSKPIAVKKDYVGTRSGAEHGRRQAEPRLHLRSALRVAWRGCSGDAGACRCQGLGPQQYVLYVIAGTGKLTLNGKGGEQIGELTYKPDDVIVFQPHTLHGWVNSDAGFEFLGFDMPVLRK